MSKVAIIIGAGPAGLTAAYELQARSDIRPVVLELGDFIGGISRTVSYKGNRMDIGGHRFFSKSDRVMQWWLDQMPAEPPPAKPNEDRLETPKDGDLHRMLVRQRVSRIYYLRKFFDYPVKLNVNTIRNLGVTRIARIGASYLKTKVAPIRKEKSLEDFLKNRFGKELYLTFFKDYTEKVWGVPCDQIKPEWGAQRIKGLSITSAVLHAMRSFVKKPSSLAQKDVETSLIEQFLYPKLGPGQLWEGVADRIRAKGGEVRLESKVVGLDLDGQRIVGVRVQNTRTGETETLTGDYVFSTMPISELIEAIGPTVPQDVQRVARGLRFRDFIAAGLLVDRLAIKNETSMPTPNGLVPDNWIYIQESDVKLGRVQVFRNWSPYMVADLNKVWLGLEYFCEEGDDLWSQSDPDFVAFAGRELAAIGMITPGAVIDGTVVRVKKAYPAYFGTYDELHVIRKFVDPIENLFLVGRNGMHRYNNADHSMLSAMTAVENILANRKNKDNLWNVNAEQEYHEEKAS